MNVTLKYINKFYANLQVLNGINLTFKDKEFTTLLGPSGCGKTTLLRIIAGLENPDAGELYFGDKCIFSKDKKINVPTNKRYLGMVFQDFALWPHMTVFENVAFPLKATGKKENLNEKVFSALKTVKLEDYYKRYPHQLSGGQQQRVAFARAIINNPEIILFDEPLSALDANLREKMRFELVNLVKKIGITVVYVTHDQVEAMSMSDKVIVINKGNVLQNDSPEAIYNGPSDKFVAQFVGKSNFINDGIIRPEKVSLVEIENSTEYEGSVENISYMGNCYELTVRTISNKFWKIYASERKSNGEKIKFYIKNSDIHILGGNEKCLN